MIIFFSYEQSAGQCFDNFVTKLKKLSEGCEFSNLQDSRLLDTIEIGIKDNHVR